MTAPIYALGQLATASGDFLKTWRDGTPSMLGSVPPAAFADEQNGEIPVWLSHDEYFTRGWVVYLERSRGGVYAVAQVTPETRDEYAPAFFSAGLRHVIGRHSGTDDTEIVNATSVHLGHVSIGATAAAVNLAPIQFLDRLDARPFGLRPAYLPVAERAQAHLRALDRTPALWRAKHLVINDTEPVPEPELVQHVERVPRVLRRTFALPEPLRLH